MTDKADKKAESIKALKDANKHLADLFHEMNKKDTVLDNSADHLTRIAQQCGDLKVNVWQEGGFKDYSLKVMLMDIATSLNGARS